MLSLKPMLPSETDERGLSQVEPISMKGNNSVIKIWKSSSMLLMECQVYRASDFFQDWWAEVTHGAKKWWVIF